MTSSDAGTVVLLTDGTVGRVASPARVGDRVAVYLNDENGNPIERTGTVQEVLQ